MLEYVENNRSSFMFFLFLMTLKIGAYDFFRELYYDFNGVPVENRGYVFSAKGTYWFSGFIHKIFGTKKISMRWSRYIFIIPHFLSFLILIIYFANFTFRQLL